MTMLARRSTVIGMAAAMATRPVRAQGKLTPCATQLGWLRNGEFAALMVADSKGFFAEEGIAHRILDGGPGKNPVPIVAVGQAQFGLATSGLHLLAARTARDPVDVIAVGTTYQIAAASLIRLANPGDPAPVPKDLEGKTVGIQAGSEYLVTALARKNGVDEAKIKVVVVQANAEPLMTGRIDYFSGWITNQTYQIETEAAKPDAGPLLKGKIWQALRFADWGLAAYADTIFCTAQTAKDNPDLVRGYLRAVSRAVSFILASPDEALKIVATYPNQIEPAEKLAWRWRVQNPLYISAAAQKSGPLWMDAATWDANGQFLLETKQVPRLVTASEIMNTTFLPKPAAG
jgi:NitT/TauT family transport system substrate-binding protein